MLHFVQISYFIHLYNITVNYFHFNYPKGFHSDA